ncbi:MAG: bifunctional indole-3-glycerol-phosphate synthase TrpC/phosphoribosylanthranilate isomerase TrpF [Anaerolineae bacterium]|nr:bifunctional indole-3-glycerol-phosphate synthase TrpC/phosphoribosylanthranilate isomerase TrpF [Anaerolineae bacterium]
MTILDDIFAHKRIELVERKQARPIAEIQAEAERATPPRDFVAVLRPSLLPSLPGRGRGRVEAAPLTPALSPSGRGGSVALIAEVKRASPSRGLLAPNFDPLRLARTYQQNGAAAISVLTDEHFFQGHLDYLRAIREQVDLPLLRKDFVFDPYQVCESRAAGADAILLIVAMLSDEELRTLHTLAQELGMAALVEVHDEAELRRALALQPRLIGINNRDLRTFAVDLATTERLRSFVPPDVTLVAESGIHTAADVDRLAHVGVDAMLVGESLVTAPDPATQVRALVRPYTRVKICGITTRQDALAAVDAGADMLGFNFYPRSKRYIPPEQCVRIVSFLAQYTARVQLVGVFVNATRAEVEAIADDCHLDLVQLSGDEAPEILAIIGDRAFKGIRPTSLEEARADAARFARSASPALLVDAHHPGKYGGTGHTGDWELAYELAAQYPILLAGGLTPENVAAAVTQVRPWGVDVASGVESSPGRKDPTKMKAFVQAARQSPT